MSRMWISGYRSYELGVFKADDPKVAVIQYALHALLLEELEQGLTWVITGGQLGVEQWTLEVAQILKADYPELQTALLLPFQNFGSNWREDKQAKLNRLLAEVDFTGVVSQRDYQNPVQLQLYQQFMLTHTDQAALVYDIDYPGKPEYDYRKIIDYQSQSPYPLRLLTMDDLQEYANDYREWQENYDK